MPFGQRLVARPADFHAAEQIGFRLGHAEHALGGELHVLAEDERVRREADRTAALLHALLHDFQRPLRHAALIDLAIKHAAARDFGFERFRKRVRYRNADAVQTAGSLVDVAGEFAARVQRGQDHFERGFILEFGVRIDRNAAAVIGDADEAVGLHLHVDEGRVARDRFVHRVVDYFRENVMQRPLIGAADIHAGAAANRLQPLEHLDRVGVISFSFAAACRFAARASAAAIRRLGLEQVRGFAARLAARGFCLRSLFCGLGFRHVERSRESE